MPTLIITSPTRLLLLGIVMGLFGAPFVQWGLQGLDLLTLLIGVGLLYGSYVNVGAWLVMMRILGGK
nr:hypothetical protein [uncultured Rhodopila sp.]